MYVCIASIFPFFFYCFFCPVFLFIYYYCFFCPVFLFIFLLKYDSWTQLDDRYILLCCSLLLSLQHRHKYILLALASYSIKKFSGLKSSHPPKARSPLLNQGELKISFFYKCNKSAAAKKKEKYFFIFLFFCISYKYI